MSESKPRSEYRCLTQQGEFIGTDDSKADITRTDDKTITIYLDNGRYVRLTSATPIVAVIDPSDD